MLEFRDRAVWVAGLAPRVGQVVARGEGVGVLDSKPVGLFTKELIEVTRRCVWATALSAGEGEVVSRFGHVGVIGADEPHEMFEDTVAFRVRFGMPSGVVSQDSL